MTRKDFELIARAISSTRRDGGDECPVLDDLVSTLADALADTSLRFDRDRFVKACQ